MQCSLQRPITLLSIYGMFGVGLLFWKHVQNINFALLACFLIAVAVALFVAGLTWSASTHRTVYVIAPLSVLAYVWSIKNSYDGDAGIGHRVHWLVLSLLTFATTLGVTSGNGIGQATGAFMIGLPLLFAIAVSSGGDNVISSNSIVKIFCVVLVTVLLAANWSRYPYREASWWQANQPIQSVSEFKFIGTSLDRAEFIQRMKHELEPVVKGKRILIISEYPGLYFALGTHPQTCMLYMHSLTSDKSEEALLNCLSKKKPEILIDVLTDKDMAKQDSRIKKVLHSYYSQRGFNCTNKTIKFYPVTENNPEDLRYSVCMQVVVEKI